MSTVTPFDPLTVGLLGHPSHFPARTHEVGDRTVGVHVPLTALVGRGSSAPAPHVLQSPPATMQWRLIPGAQSGRRLWAMRLLGRLEYMTTAMLYTLIYQDQCGQSAMYDELGKLVKEGMIWRVRAPASVNTVASRAKPFAPPLAPPYVYGLTDRGRELLIEMEVEGDEAVYNTLRSRDPRGRPPSVLTMEHDLQVAWFCSNALRSAQLSRYVRGVRVEVEYVIHQRQRIDALLTLRVGKKPLPERHQQIPLLSAQQPREADETDVHIGLEVDKSTESLRIIAEKAVAYRNFTNQGTYQKALGGFLLPVFLVPTSLRAGRISLAWRKVWPNGLGLISTPRSVCDRQLGVLWGTYLTLASPDARADGLINDVGMAADGRVMMQPLLSREQWQADQGE